MSDPDIKMSPEVAITLWRALRDEDRSEADLLAAVIIGNKVEPVFEDQEETLDFYKEYLITQGFVEEVSSTH
jgi:hypothetical protein|tara:strand:+ start:7600 stop:7815 length:216 start_codon:yes stop_codon:yes gene_type:complete